jgi:hypothetical protein
VTASTPADSLPTGTNLPARKEHWLTGTTAASLAQLFLLLLAGWVRRHALNPDGVAYLRIAGYYAHGQTDLAVSGYWGPLLSGLMTPLLALGFSPLPVARVVMALTAVFFFRSCLAVFRAFELPEWLQRLGAWLAVGLSVCWSVENITPDLLAAGLVGYAVSFMIKPGWHERWPTAVWAGLLWGLAFLAKAAAFPFAIVVTAGMAVACWNAGIGDGKKIGRSVLATLLGFAIVAGPWVAAVSVKYHQLTISRSAQLNHAMVGPSDMERYYPLDRGLQPPEAGRVTFWEDPDLPYPDWSPLANAASAQRQLLIILRNAPRVAFMLTCVCGLFPVLLIIFAAKLVRAESRRTLAGERWWWAWVPVGALGAAYLSGNLLISEQRYFYAAFPFLFVLCVGIFMGWKPAGFAPGQPRCRACAIVLAFLLPTLARPTVWRPPGTTAGDCAWTLAKKLSALNIAGPVASSAQMHGGRAGMYVAFHLGVPWYGDARQPSASEFEQSRARLIIVNRDLSVCGELSRDTNFIDLDGRLFGSPEEAAQFPLKAFQHAIPVTGGGANAQN